MKVNLFIGNNRHRGNNCSFCAVSRIVLVTVLFLLACAQQVKGQTIQSADLQDLSTVKETKSFYALCGDDRKVNCSLADKYSQIKDALGATDGAEIYLRWSIVDSERKLVKNLSSWTMTATGDKLATLPDNDGFCATSLYLWSWNQDLSNKKYDVSVSIPDGVDIQEYQVACAMAKGHVSLDSNSSYQEPEIGALFLFNMVTEEELKNLFEVGKEPAQVTGSKLVLCEDNGDSHSATLNLYDDFGEGIKNYYNSQDGKLKNAYLKWCVQDESGKVVDEGVSFTGASGYSYRTGAGYIYNGSFGDQWNLNSDNLKNCLNNIHISLPDSKYQVVFLMSNQTPETLGGFVVQEPDFQLKYVYELKTREEIESMFETGKEPESITGTKDAYCATEDNAYSATLNLYDDFGEGIKEYYNNTSDKFQNSYLKWYVQDENGKVVDEGVSFSSENASSDYSDRPGVGYIYNSEKTTNGLHYHWNNEANDAELKKVLNNIHVSLPDSKYKVVFLMSNQKPESLEGIVIKEPDFQLKYVYELKTREEIDEMFEPGKEPESIAGTKDAYCLADGDVYSAILNLFDDFGTSIKDYYNDALDKFTHSYLRWYVQDEEGKIVKEGVSFNSANASSDYSERPGVGYIYNSNGLNNANDDKFKELLNNIHVSLPDSKYKVVFLMSNQKPESLEGIVIKEPDFQLKYVYELKTREEIENMFEPGQEPDSIYGTKYVYCATEDNAYSVDLNLFDDFGEDVSKYYESKEGKLKNAYLKWYVQDESGKVVDDGVSFTGSSDYSYRKGAGYIYNGSLGEHNIDGSKLQIVLNNIHVSLPDSKYKVVFLMSNQKPEKTLGGIVIKEPDFQLKYVYTLRLDDELKVFNHYEGIANAPGDYEQVNAGIRQKTHEYIYEIYVKRGETIDMKLPFEKVDGDGNDLEHQAYIRWYDWNTDYMPVKSMGEMTPYNGQAGNFLKEQYFEDNGLSRGLFVSMLDSNPTVNNGAAVKFTAPETDEWSETIIACDVSKYTDGSITYNSNKYWEHEPTLSIRYKFVVRAARTEADEIRRTLEYPEYEGENFEGGSWVTVGLDENGKGEARFRVKTLTASNYYFYPFKITRRDEEGNPIQEFGDDMVQATHIKWRVYESTGKYCRDFDKKNSQNLLDKNGCFFAVSLSKLEGDYTSRDYMEGLTTEKTTKHVTFKPGDIAYFVAYAADDNGNSSPIGRYNVKFLANSSPKLLTEIEEKYYYRHVDYMNAHYLPIAQINFDDYNNLDKPTDPFNNMSSCPFDFHRSSYGYCYPQLYSNIGQKYNIGLAPIHGDYTILKSMNMPGVSDDKNGQADFIQHFWYKTELYDCTHFHTNGTQYGSFFYVDASDETRPMAEISFDGEMCTGAALIFTAAVANMTEDASHVPPQIIFKVYGIKTDAEGNETSRKLINAFVTGDFSTVGASEFGKWYQVYGRVMMDKSLGVEDYETFVVSMDNYCAKTYGADYAIDDIRIYLDNSKVETAQRQTVCNNEDVELKITVPYEVINAMLGNVTAKTVDIFYRICDENGKPVTDIYDSDGDGIADNGTIYEKVVFTPLSLIPEGANMADYGYETDDNGNLMFVVADKSFALPSGNSERYFVSIADMSKNVSESDLTDETLWGKPSVICSVYSDMFIAMCQSLRLTDMNGQILNTIPVECTASEAKVNLKGEVLIPDPDTGGNVVMKDNKFDWIVMKKSDVEANPGRPKNLGAALNEYRKQYPDDDEWHDEYNGDFAEELKQAIVDGYVYLRRDNSLIGVTYEFGVTYNIYAVPLVTSVTINGKVYEVCPDPMEVTVKAEHNGPKMRLGFKGVRYPDDYEFANVRVGLGQINNMKSGTPLHIPVNSYSYQNMNEGAERPLMLCKEIVLVSTNDPLNKEKEGKTIANFSDGAYVDTNRMFVEIRLDGDSNADFDFHEGYEYELMFEFYDSEDESKEEHNRCYGEMYFTMKIVPEYVTWTGNVPFNTNWMNDGNWTRSTKEELYKNIENTDGYSDYGEGGIAGLSRLDTYIPMRFTKVTVASNATAPYLFELSRDVHSGILSRMMGADKSQATKNVEYDIMVKVEPESCKHGAQQSVYECEKFYGNICKEIYFKPSAELRYQHFLDYGKAWVEVELESGRWYTLASPLLATYAGDMYAPFSKPGIAEGRQETEAFQDISFNRSQGYSRSGYPVYQRSWDSSESKVIVPEGDIRAEHEGDHYEADIDYEWGSDVETVWSQWSHVYNDVEVPYNVGYGFSLKARKDAEITEKALFRLPKQDTVYDYYDYADKAEGGRIGDVEKVQTEYARLATDMNALTGVFNLSLAKNAHEENKYVLVGNPYMATLDMSRFFERNPLLENVYWTVVAGEMQMAEVGYIKPFQSFFVKAKEGAGSDLEIQFRPSMTVPKEGLVSQIVEGVKRRNDSEQAIELHSKSRHGDSHAVVVVSEVADDDFFEEEDIETIFDSNLDTTPVLYTVAGAKAATVNRLNDVCYIPIGLSGGSNETIVEVTFSGMEALDKPLYLYDAATRSAELLSAGKPVELQPNVHGRYYMTTLLDLSDDYDATDAIRCYSPAAGTIVCSASANDEITTVAVYNMDGRMVRKVKTDGSSVVNVTSEKGIYLVRIFTGMAPKGRSFKVVVR
ncbi:MAG: T9SS type A sorting domain-containing protein [Roseburia sp.]|nr:T9SS type A sorting domain-containing protein [Roseburia sp.]MCM1420713.1 T9SS type A sorting domain-containing protein [Bacteroides sp.]